MSNPSTPYSGSNTSFGQSVDVQVAWRDIKYSVKVSGKSREILRGLTGNALARRTLAVMGSSGAGKTTLVNALSGRLASDGKNTILEGQRYLNNVEYERKYRTMVGYVTQDDILNPMSTPEESFAFSLRCRRGTDHEETKESVDKMIEELGLEKARNTIVGVPGLVQGLSGGERKRTNIGVELITNPKILYLDEPTSGLDSVTSSRICETLQKLARRGRTVVFSIHQPTAACVSFFDDLMLMVKGGVIYHGPMETAVEYFASIGYECPSQYTPTDYFMTLMQDDGLQDQLLEKWDQFLNQRNRDEYAYTAPPAVDNESFTERYLTSYSSNARASPLIEFTELMKRAHHNVVRNKLLIVATLIQNIFFGIVCALIFANLTDNVTGISDRIGLLFMVTTNIGFSSVTAVINNFGPQKAVYIRDQQSGSYSSVLFHLTTFIADFPLAAIALFLQAIVIYFPTRLVLGADNFFLFYAIMLFTQQVGNSMGMAISIGIDNYIVASGVAPMIVIPFMLCSGLMSSTDRLRPYWVWLEKPSFLRAGALLLFHNEFENLGDISCDVGKYGADFCLRQPKNGNQVLEAYGFADEQSSPWVQWIVLACVFVFCRILVQLLLVKVGHTKS